MDQMKATQRTVELAYVYIKQVCSSSHYMIGCTKTIIAMLNAHVAKVTESFKTVQCFDVVYTPIFKRLREGLGATLKSQVVAVKMFASQTIWTAPLDLVEAYKDIVDGLDGKEMVCSRTIMKAARDELESVHKEVQECPDGDQSSAGCYKRNLNRMVAHFNRANADQKNSKCFDKTFDFSSIPARILHGLSLGDDASMNTIITFADSEIINTDFKYSTYFYKISETLKKASQMDCHIWNVIDTGKKLETAHNGAIDCFESAGDDQDWVHECASAIIDKLRGYWDKEDRDLKARKCVNKDYDIIREYVRGGYKLRLVTLIRHLREYSVYQPNTTLLRQWKLKKIKKPSKPRKSL